MRIVIAALKMVAFILICLVIVPVQILVLAITKGPKSYIMTHLWHVLVCKAVGISIHVEGDRLNNKSTRTFFMSNHISYLDIPALGSVIPRASFLAKSEVKGWPVFGFLATLQQTAFIQRKRSAIKDESDKIRQDLKDKKNLILFPEGTSTDGYEVKPFKSSLFTLPMENFGNDAVMIQPVSIVLNKTDRREPKTLERRRLYTWPLEDDIELPAHLWRFMKHRGAHLRIIFHPPIDPHSFENRKDLAKACYAVVSKPIE